VTVRYVPRDRPRMDERVLPLVNVVFLLLIFFILAGRLAASDAFRVEPPETRAGQAADPGELVVLVAADGRLALDGEIVTQRELSERLTDALEGSAAPAVRVKADGRAAATEVVAVMEAIRGAGAQKIRLLTVLEDR